MKTLALDSSVALLQVALLEDGALVSARSVRARRPTGDGLPGLIEGVLHDAQVPVESLNMLAVGVGPGSFNGIRGGIATAVGLSLALSIPAVGVETLDALASPHRHCAPTLCAVLSAGRDALYSASYERSSGRMQRVGDYRVGSADEAFAHLQPRTIVCGCGDDSRGGAVADEVRARGMVYIAGTIRAEAIGLLGEERWREGEHELVTVPRPLYLRNPGITSPRRPLSALSTVEQDKE